MTPLENKKKSPNKSDVFEKKNRKNILNYFQKFSAKF